LVEPRESELDRYPLVILKALDAANNIDQVSITG
jgi:hypothetical protein